MYPIQSQLEQPFAFSQGWVTRRGATIVQVLTDEGLVGWGEALCMGLQSPVIASATVRSTLGPLVIGEDPTNVEVLWHRMYNHVRDYGAKGAVVGAISAIDIALWLVQPDVCHAGGFTACRHIAALAQAYGVQVNPHVWGSSIGQMTSLHLIAALPIANHALTAHEPIFEYDTSSHPFRTQLIENPIEQKDGWIEIPDTPGLGVRVNLEVLERYRV
ncbi:MAG: hypothetical protein K6T81_08790 [Alicyclobacillus macrosporangiidus]|uniref:enolase C-terminal domain-like protein n=1 Tax=Alicyclobacillus macrosporangiidus TaxID=392015 RepID=UPI0026ECEA45|nr:enolase C-terminal domain-like protein [Alicyclobacillus macrosporangiidus]MCL6598825.1 hypothetical protein [Alicyclobacillus macrosporangiidus]